MKECQSCHGRRGRGDGPGARHLNVAVPDLTSADVRSETDGKWFDSITKGSKPMPAYRRRLSERQRWDVVNYLRSDIAPPVTPSEPGGPPPAAGAMTQPTTGAVTREEYDRLRSELNDVKQRVDERRGGGSIFDDDRFLVTGYASAGYVNRRSVSTFTAGINPIFVFRINDRIFVESEVGLELATEDGVSSTETNLEYADINFIVNDYMTVTAGKFLTPFGQFPERLHPAWINKLSDFPLPYNEETGLVPFSSLGVQVRGAVPVGRLGPWSDGKVVYAAYVANGPSLIEDSADEAGNLNFENFTDNNDSKAVGGRLGFLPVPELEIGGSIQWGKVSGDADALLLGVDAAYQKEIQPISGTIEARVEWIWSSVDTVTFDETGAAGFGPLRYKNDRNGGYAQLAYRPTLCDNRMLRNLELVTRYDTIHVPAAAPGAATDTRLTFGVDYWLAPNVLLKAAYQIDSPEHGPHDNGVMLQAAVGF